MKSPSTACSKCGSPTKDGRFQVHGNARVEFVVPGTKTSLNPVTAFKQGLSDEQSDLVYNLSAFQGRLCPNCGFLEFYINAKS